ncbi:hypothetical protein F511_17902 [Dorcoceras hygrometricum]|uniref:Retrotransposon Copia-like N-terminal domain-containing protein n=1 Tax=Dorcoceras hygrometricum TaxID=472368 RepID=A0A2Z7AMD1_9LAMI|nr:hypothetical protein F511_17902 [Dorcoceras hygrometricum]
MSSKSTVSGDTTPEKLSSVSIAPFSRSDMSSLQITTHLLNGRNYLQWAQSVKIVVCARGKLGYLTGDLPPPATTDPAYPTWLADNSIVLAWLINSMETNISRRYLWFQTAKEVWDAVRRMYSDLGNTSQVFELRSKLKEIKQGSNTVTHYFSDLQELWQELDLFLEESRMCAECSGHMRRTIERERVFDFLAGLNRELDDVRGRIVARDPFPSTDDAFSEVRREELRRKVMLPDSSSSEVSALASIQNPVSEPSALASAKNSGQRQGRRPWCDHCHRPGHTKDTCWEIHGKPANWQSRKQSDRRSFQAHSVQEQPSSSRTSTPFTAEQIEQLEKYCRLLRETALTPPVGSCSVTQSGIIYSTLISAPSPSWIIDSGASDHMTGNLNSFCSYTPCNSDMTVRIADGSLSRIHGIGDINVSRDITLKNVFHVPSLKCNLISVSKLTRDCHCRANFSSGSCLFQDHLSGKKIGSAKLHDGLYYLESSSSNGPQSLLSCVPPKSSLSNQEIMLLHFRLGHPSFPYLARLFPSLSINKNLSLLRCEHCELAKHTRTPFPQKTYTPSVPFFNYPQRHLGAIQTAYPP